MGGGRVKIICAGWRTLTLHKGNHRITQCDSVNMARQPQGSHIVVPIAVSGSGHTRKQIYSLDAVIHMQVRLKSGS